MKIFYCITLYYVTYFNSFQVRKECVFHSVWGCWKLSATLHISLEIPLAVNVLLVASGHNACADSLTGASCSLKNDRGWAASELCSLSFPSNFSSSPKSVAASALGTHSHLSLWPSGSYCVWKQTALGSSDCCFPYHLLPVWDVPSR